MIRVFAHRLTARSLALVAFDSLLILSAVGAATYMRLGPRAWTFLIIENGVAKAILVAAVVQVCLYYADLYDLRSVADRYVLFTRMVHALPRPPSPWRSCTTGFRSSSSAAAFS